jgi:hypothetical protein
MVILDVELISEKHQAPTPKAIELQRQKQLEAVIRIRSLLIQADPALRHKVA